MLSSNYQLGCLNMSNPILLKNTLIEYIRA